MRKLLVFAPIALCLLPPVLWPGLSTTLDVGDPPPAAQFEVGDTHSNTVPFWKVEVKPQPISIPEAVYPEKAREAGIEGSAVVEALIDTNGSVADTRIFKTSGNSLLDQSAVEAAMRAKFRPGRQRDKPVRVWVSLPFRFRLDDGKKTGPPASEKTLGRDQTVIGDGPTRPLDSLLKLPTPPQRYRAPVRVPAEPRPAVGLDSALAALARMLTDSTHGESLPRLAVTPFEGLNGSVGDTGVYIAEVLESDLAASGRCRVVEREAIAQLLGVVAPTRAAVMETTARRSLVRVFRLAGIVVGTVVHMEGGLKVMAHVVNPRTGLITRTGEVWFKPEAMPQNIPTEPPPHVPPTYPSLPSGVIRFEGEDMKVLRVTSGIADRQASNQRWAGSWSGSAHLWWRNAKLGDRLELGFDVPATGTYEVKLQLTKAIDYGIEQCCLDGRKLGGPTDLYNGLTSDNNSHAVANTGPLDMGSHKLKQGQHKLEFRIVGINPRAVQSYMFGIDYLDLERQESAGRAGNHATGRLPRALPGSIAGAIKVAGS